MNIKSILFVTLSFVFFTNVNADVYNVRDYGAVGDGTTNDTAAFNAAVDAASLAGGGTVHVPCGEYLIGKELGYAAGFYSGIQISSSNISLTGEGRCSELQPVNSSGNAIVAICSSVKDGSCKAPAGISDIKVSNLAFRDPAPFFHTGSEESHGIVAKEAINLVIENNYFIGIGDESVDISSGQDITIRGNHFDACPSIPGSGGSAISVSGSRHVSIDGNSIVNAPLSSYNRGIDIATNAGKPTSWINITNNRFLDNEYARDILIASSQATIKHVVISSNQIESKTTAIAFSGSNFEQSDIRIIDNDMSGNILSKANNLVIANNSISGNEGHALKVAGYNVKVLNNIIKDFPKACLFVTPPDSPSSLEFSGNSCINTSADNSDVISFYSPDNFTGKVIIKNNILDASPGSKAGVSRVGSKIGIGGGVNAAITENTISGVLKGIIGGGLISHNIITNVSQYGILVAQDGAQVTNNRINGAGSRCIFINAAGDAIVSGNFMENCGIFAIKIKNGGEHSICMGNNARNNLVNVNIDCDIMVGNIQPGS